MLNLETSYGYNLYTLRRYLNLLKSGKLAKAEKESLLIDCRKIAKALNVDLGNYNSEGFGEALETRNK